MVVLLFRNPALVLVSGKPCLMEFPHSPAEEIISAQSNYLVMSSLHYLDWLMQLKCFANVMKTCLFHAFSVE